MRDYGKNFFDHCLTAIVAELGRLEKTVPNWPNDPAHAAGVVWDQAATLFEAAARKEAGPETEDYPVLKEAVRTAAMTLKLLLSMKYNAEREHAPITHCNEREFISADLLDEE